MAVGDLAFPELPPLNGVRLGSAMAGIKKPNRRDVVVIELPETATVAGVFTRNAFCAAPVVVAKAHLEACASAERVLVHRACKMLMPAVARLPSKWGLIKARSCPFQPA